MEGDRLKEATAWVLENPTESLAVATRLFNVPKSKLRWSVTQARRPPVSHGGQNRVLSVAQTIALKEWILLQYHKGLGATRQFGGELTAAHAHELRAQKLELAAQKLEAKRVRVARQAANRARKQLRRAGIEAWKEERLRKKRVAALRKAGLPIPLEFEDPIPDPEALETGSEGESGSGSEGNGGSEEVIIS